MEETTPSPVVTDAGALCSLTSRNFVTVPVFLKVPEVSSLWQAALPLMLTVQLPEALKLGSDTST